MQSKLIEETRRQRRKYQSNRWKMQHPQLEEVKETPVKMGTN